MPAPSSEPTPPPEPWGWTRPQRITLAILTAVLFLILIPQFLRHPALLTNHAVTLSGTPVSLPSKLDPNTATLEQLQTVANLPAKTAADILAWRTAHAAATPDGIVFHSLTDMAGIPGVTKKNLDQLRPLLEFPDATQPGAGN